MATALWVKKERGKIKHTKKQTNITCTQNYLPDLPRKWSEQGSEESSAHPLQAVPVHRGLPKGRDVQQR